MRHQSRYSTTTVAEFPRWDIRFTAYAHYPRATSDLGGVRVFVEGAIYNKPSEQVCSELANLSVRIAGSPDDSERLTQSWILENDGEYIAIVADPSAGQVVLITDALGRLPLFYYEYPGGILIAREPKYIIAAGSNKRLDPIGVAEFLMFGYNMGERTMSDGIRRFGPAALVRLDSRENRLDKRYVHQWHVGVETDAHSKLSATADFVAQGIRDATRTRACYGNDYRPVLSLSGGLDSRAVAAAMHHEGIEFASITTVNPGHSNRTNVALAARIAEVFSQSHTEYMTQPVTLAGVQSLVRHQEGGSMALMAPSETHLQRLESEFGCNVVIFTGDGGNNVMYPYLPDKPVRTVDDVVERTFGTVFYWDIGTIERVLRIDGDTVRQAYQEVIDSYPEDEPQWKYGHFKFMGRPYRFVMEGEDRTRFHFWLGAPFWSLPLVQRLLTVPEDSKANYRLYRAVLGRIDPRCLQFPYAATLEFKVPIRYLTLYAQANRVIKSQSWLYRGLRTALIRRSKQGYRIPAWEDELRRIVRESALVAEYFDVNRLAATLEAGLSIMQYTLLATVLFRIDLAERDFSPEIG